MHTVSDVGAAVDLRGCCVLPEHKTKQHTERACGLITVWFSSTQPQGLIFLQTGW